MSFLETIITMLTGCGCFLVGASLMSRGFVRICQRPGSKILRMFSPKNLGEGILTGVTHSLIVQSSASTAVLSIGLLNAGAITLLQATPIIMGANIGTTLTAFLVAFSTIGNIKRILSFFVFIGGIMFLSNKKTIKVVGEILSGFGLVFVGLEMMDLYVDDPQISSALKSLFLLSDNFLLLILFGCLVTALFQSSSVTTSIMVLMVSVGVLPLSSAIYIVMGANIGTCITSLLASNGSNVNAKRLALINVLFNVFGVLMFLVLIWVIGDKMFAFIDGINTGEGMKLALFHLVFNVGTTIVLLPFTKLIVKLVKKMVTSKAR